CQANSTGPGLAWDKTARTFFLLSLLLVLLSPILSPAAPPPKLWFQKQLQKESAQQEAKVYSYKVRKGENIHSILRNLGLEKKMLPQALQEVKDLNPQIQDLGRIQPGQEIALPHRLKPEQDQKQTSQPDQIPDSGRDTIPTRTYQVQDGEYLTQILRQELNLPKELIYDEYLNLVLKLNPDLGDPGLLQAGDRLQLPLLKDQSGAAGPGKDQASLQEPQKISAQPEAQAADSRSQEPQKDPDRQTLLSLLRLLHFSFAPGQEMFLPLPDGGWLQLNLEQSALARTPWDFSILLVPESKSSLLQEQGLQHLDLRLCPAGDWSLDSVLPRLQETTQRRLLLWPREKALILSGEHRVLELEAEFILVQRLQDKRQYHLLHTSQKQAPGIPGLLLGYLQSQDIYYHTLDPDLENKFSTIAPPRAKDIYLPRLRDLEAFAQTLSNPRQPQEKDQEYLKRLLQDQASLQEETVHLSWGGSPSPEINLTLRLLQIKTGENSLLVLPPAQENPYLLALLRQAGYDCFVF
ncbi:MAG: LysM peptidoglycan-binding domain-containing protein, partial [Desulfohalobiaceae bacterium]